MLYVNIYYIYSIIDVRKAVSWCLQSRQTFQLSPAQFSRRDSSRHRWTAVVGFPGQWDPSLSHWHWPLLLHQQRSRGPTHGCSVSAECHLYGWERESNNIIIIISHNTYIVTLCVPVHIYWGSQQPHRSWWKDTSKMQAEEESSFEHNTSISPPRGREYQHSPKGRGVKPAPLSHLANYSCMLGLPCGCIKRDVITVRGIAITART